MTDKEKIRAEIERRMNKHKYSTALTEMVYAEEDENLLAFIDSMPEEPSCPKESYDLDKLMKEVQKYYSDNFDYITSDQPTLSILTNIARHFTEWQKRKMMEWAKEHKRVIETHGNERDAYLRGEYSMLNSLIDQLNSM